MHISASTADVRAQEGCGKPNQNKKGTKKDRHIFSAVAACCCMVANLLLLLWLPLLNSLTCTALLLPLLLLSARLL
jgi:Flp pilus assembly protein TadB